MVQKIPDPEAVSVPLILTKDTMSLPEPSLESRVTFPSIDGAVGCKGFEVSVEKKDDARNAASVSSAFKSKLKNIFRKKTLYNRLPILKWLPKYKVRDLPSDIIAGFSVGLTLVPQGIAYAIVAGLPPQHGLYSSFMGCFIYLILGSTKSLTLGPTALLAISTYPYVSKWGPDIAVFLCFISGVLELLLGIFNLGFLLDFISSAVVDGFCSAAAVTIASTQLKGLFGLSYESEGFLETVIEFFHHTSEIKLWDTVMGFTSIVVLLLLRALGQTQIPNTRVSLRIVSKSFWFLSTARNAICVFVCAGIAAALYDPITGESPLVVIGNITAGVPPFITPPFQLTNQTTGEVLLDFFGLLKETGTSLIIIPLVAILEAVAIAKSFARGQKVDASQEMIAIGFSNIMSSFVLSFPVTGSFSRTAVNEASGVRSPLSGVVTGSIVLLAAAFLTPYFFYIPKASLSAVIITAVLLMIEYHVILPMWRTKKTDLIPLGVTFFVGLLFGLEFGIIIGAAVHIMMMSFGNARPKIRIETKQENNGTCVIIQCRESLVFPAADHFSSVVRKAIRKAPEVQTVIFDLNFVSRLDYATGKTLKTLSDELSKIEVVVLVSNLSPQACKVLKGLRAKNLKIM